MRARLIGALVKNCRDAYVVERMPQATGAEKLLRSKTRSRYGRRSMPSASDSPSAPWPHCASVFRLSSILPICARPGYVIIPSKHLQSMLSTIRTAWQRAGTRGWQGTTEHPRPGRVAPSRKACLETRPKKRRADSATAPPTTSGKLSQMLHRGCVPLKVRKLSGPAALEG